MTCRRNSFPTASVAALLAMLCSSCPAFSNTLSKPALTLLRSDQTGLEFIFHAPELGELGSAALADKADWFLDSDSPGQSDLPRLSKLVVIPPTAAVTAEWQSDPPRIVAEKTGGGMDSDNSQAVVHLGEPVIMRGVRMAPVTISPYQYDDAGNLMVRDNIVVSLKFSAGEPVNPVENPDRPRPSRVLRRMLRPVVVNPEALRDDGGERGSFVYVIPDYAGVENVIAPLVKWRRQQGYPTEIITVAEDASNVDVKQALQDAYDDWDIPPEIITLVGEADLQEADFMIPTEDVGRQYMWETDYKYALLEGQDLLPEAAVGRISCRSLQELRRVVSKIVKYETLPYMDETDWFTSAALMANDSRTGYSSIYVQRWARQLLLEVGFAAVDTFYFIHDNEVTGKQFIANNINQGISLFNYRGWGQFNGDWVPGDARNLRNGAKLPLMLLPTCNTADFADHVQFPNSYAEEFLWAGAGAVATIGSSGFTHTNYNNVIDGGIINGFYRDGVWQFGWALNRGKLEMYRHFGAFDDLQDPQVPSMLIWEAIVYQTNLIGDAGTELWTAVPQQLAVEHPDTVWLGGNEITVRVRNSDDENGWLEGVSVTLMSGDDVLKVGETDADGRVIFSFTTDELDTGTVKLTASRHNLVPNFSEIVVTGAEHFISASSYVIDDDRAGGSNGNGDGLPNPGETIELSAYLTNTGSETPNGEINAALSATAGDVDVVDGEAVLQSAPAVGDSTLVTFILTLGWGNWDGRRILLNITASAGDEEWHSVLDFPAVAPNLEYAAHAFTPAVPEPGDTAWIDITLVNIGGLASTAMNAELVSRREAVNVFNSRAQFSVAEAGGDDSTTARFRVHAHDLTIPGTSVPMVLRLRSDDGFTDSTVFSFTVGAPGDGTPFGPDAYGYGCFDNTDEDWSEVAPTYDWWAIDPGEGGDGTDTEINDLGNEQDWSVLVDFPEEFHFQYYGQEFDKLTICSNGWLALGDESKLADFQNRRIPPALGPRAQICVFWDDLINYVEDGERVGGIYYQYDEENHRFIVEWSKMRRYIGLDEDGNLRPGGENTFQAILYDPQYYQTYTGDGDIVMQYHTVHNDRDVDPAEFDTPFATVGIVNLNGTDGMEYTYWGAYTPGAAPLADERAIKFSTRLIAVVGAVKGRVTDAETGAFIANAEISGNKGAFALTEADGSYLMDNVLIGAGYTFTAWASGYNDSIKVSGDTLGFTVSKGETLVVDFALLHPEFNLSTDSIRYELQPDADCVGNIALSNDGNGPLTFSSYFDYAGGGNDQRWWRLHYFNVTNATGDNKINGVDFFAGNIWVTGSNNNEDPNYFYLFDQQGHYSSRLAQPGTSAYGFRGTTTAGGLLYGGDGEWILGVDNSGMIQDSIPGPLSLQRDIAYESYRDSVHFWVANGPDEPLTRIDGEGNIVAQFQLELDTYGLGWFPDDQEGYPLYILSRDKTHPALQVPEALVSKLNPETGDLISVLPLEGDLEDRAGGMEISNTLDPTKWVMMAVMTNPDGDRVSVYDMGPNTSWVRYEPRYGRLDAGQNTAIHLSINSAGLVEGDYALILRFIHNAAALESSIRVDLNVDWDNSLPDESSVPLEFGIDAVRPNPFNGTTVVSYQLSVVSFMTLKLYDLNGRLVQTVVEGWMPAGQHRTAIDGSRLAAGVYFVRLAAGGRTETIKTALVK